LYGHLYACMLSYMQMRRTALFLKEQQLDKLQKLADKTGAPVAELVRRAIDAYLLSRKKELK
jgi:predicted DNA-binding protein